MLPERRGNIGIPRLAERFRASEIKFFEIEFGFFKIKPDISKSEIESDFAIAAAATLCTKVRNTPPCANVIRPAVAGTVVAGAAARWPRFFARLRSAVAVTVALGATAAASWPRSLALLWIERVRFAEPGPQPRAAAFNSRACNPSGDRRPW